MDDKMLSELVQKYQENALEANNILVCYEDQFKAIIGALGNFFIGQRMFEVVLL